jgi:hypothetical protein
MYMYMCMYVCTSSTTVLAKYHAIPYCIMFVILDIFVFYYLYAIHYHTIPPQTPFSTYPQVQDSPPPTHPFFYPSQTPNTQSQPEFPFHAQTIETLDPVCFSPLFHGFHRSPFPSLSSASSKVLHT